MQFDLFQPEVGDIMAASNYAEYKKRLVKSNCSKCPDLCQNRTTIVADRGNPQTKLVLIGEAPGENEDRQGLAFVGRAGQLLDKIMLSVGLDTNRDMLILNVVKCRPPENRAPKPAEGENCLPYLQRQLEFVKPRLVVLLGATAARYFIPRQVEGAIRDAVGTFFDVPEYPGIKFMLLYHPAYLLRDPRKKTEMWKHVQYMKEFLVKEGL